MYKFLDKEYEVLTEPLSSKQIAERITNEGFIEGVVIVSLYDLIDGDLEGFIDILSYKLIDCLDLIEMKYRIVGLKSGIELLIHVSGYADAKDYAEGCVCDVCDGYFEEGCHYIGNMGYNYTYACGYCIETELKKDAERVGMLGYY